MARALAFYGDSVGDEVFAIDVDRMTLAARIPTGQGPYPVDEVAPGRLLFAITRKENAITPIDLATLAPLDPIPLPHKPRSSQGSPLGLVLVSGADRPLTSVVDLASSTVRATVGIDAPGVVEDFGGSLASGHERWLPGYEGFLLLDRVHRTIAVYRSGTAEKLWSVNSPTSMHHLVPDPNETSKWFAVCEGNPKSRVPPSVLVLVEEGMGFSVASHLFLPVPDYDLPRMGGHHLDFHPDKRHIYIGSNEGRCYVIDKARMQVVATITTGLGHGHTGFAKVGEGILAVSVNHIDQHVSIIDAVSHRLLENVVITSKVPTGSQRTQGHTTGVRDGKFYVMASLDARFCEIDLESRKLVRTLDLPRRDSATTDPIPMQGTFVWQAPARMATNCC